MPGLGAPLAAEEEVKGNVAPVAAFRANATITNALLIGVFTSCTCTERTQIRRNGKLQYRVVKLTGCSENAIVLMEK